MLPTIPAFEPPYIAPISIVLKQEEPRPPDYIIKEGDTLTSISEALGVPLNRLWAANTQLANPDVLAVADPLKVPLNTDILQDRPFPAMISNTETRQTGTAVIGGSLGSGNSYSIGFCTHYAKQRRPDLPNSLGNADTWYIRYNGPKGSEPKAGAVGVAKGYMHVVYVESVNTDGTVNISEQNYQGFGVVSSRTAPASEFLYLY